MRFTDLLNYIRSNPWLVALVAGIVIYLVMNRSTEGFQDPSTPSTPLTDAGVHQLSDPVHPKVVDTHLIKVGTNGHELHIVTHHPDRLQDQIKKKYGNMPVDQLLDQMQQTVIGAIDRFFYQAKQQYRDVRVDTLVDATTDGMNVFSQRLQKHTSVPQQTQGVSVQASQSSQPSQPIP